jgi:hypothetical protein
MKKILLHRSAIDNAGRYQDAGATLTIADGDKPETISAERAGELLDNDGAVPVPTATRDPLDHDGDGRKGGAVKVA